METLNIKNCPTEAYDYEFIIITNDFEYITHTTNGFEAETIAKAFNGVIIHNVRIQGKRKEEKKKFYSFTGIWGYGCYATSKEEAIKQFSEATIEEFDIFTGDPVIEELTDED